MNREEEALKLLKSVRKMDHIIQEVQDEIDNIYCLLTSTTVKPKEVDVQTSGAQDPMADRIIKMLEYEEQLQNYQADLCSKKSSIIRVLQHMKVKDQELLNIRYIKGKTIEETAEELGQSYYGTWKQLNKAEDNFIEKYIQLIEVDTGCVV